MPEIATKLFKMAAVLGGAVVVLRLVGPKLGPRMEHMFEGASEDFPPKWMFLNITAIRENTERILETLTDEASETDAA